MTMIEQVARAMGRYTDGHEVKFAGGSPKWLIYDTTCDRVLDESYLSRADRDAQIRGLNARSALSAMETPTEEMVEAGIASLGSDDDRPTGLKIVEIWQAMNRAALAVPASKPTQESKPSDASARQVVNEIWPWMTEDEVSAIAALVSKAYERR